MLMWDRIGLNALSGFCTGYIAANITHDSHNISIALIACIIQGLAAALSEIKNEMNGTQTQKLLTIF